MASADHCQRLCANYPGCAYFTYAKAEPDQLRCWIKGPGSFRNRREASNRISGGWSCYRTEGNVGGKEDMSL